MFPSRGVFLLGWFSHEGVDCTQHRFFSIRGLFVLPSKLIVNSCCSHPRGGFLIRGVFLLRGGYYYTIPYHTIPYYTILYYTILYYTMIYYTILCYTILSYTILYYYYYYYYYYYFTIRLYSILSYYITLYHIVLPRRCSGRPASTRASPCSTRAKLAIRQYNVASIGWSDNEFENIIFKLSPETKEMTTCAGDTLLMFVIF